MASQGGDDSRFSTTGIITVLLVVASAFWAFKSPLVSTRPSAPEKVSSLAADVQDIDARLWQDPFAAVRARGKGADVAETKGAPEATCRANYRSAVREDLKGREVVVAAAMVFGGPYAEGAEHRRRIRYAVLSGLNAAGFSPYDYEHIGCFVVPFQPPAKPLQVPFEWMEEGEEEVRQKGETPRSILLLWLDESRFGKTPLEKLDDVLKQVVAAHSSQKSPGQGRGGSGKQKVRVIGPAGSNVLKDMQKDTLPPLSQSLDIEFYTAMATGEVKRRGGLKVFQAIPTDRSLMGPLIEELKLRQVSLFDLQPRPREDIPDTLKKLWNSLRGKKVTPGIRVNHVALISEWDTVYGRSLPRVLMEEVCSEGKPPMGRLEKYMFDKCLETIEDPNTGWVHRFSYMRGLDGSLPGTSGGANTPQSRKEDSGKNQKPDLADREQPEGDSQLDYLRRIADRIAERNDTLQDQGNEIRVIGILGSDVYDKLLLLQALRGKLPQAVFFTTDLDSRLLHPGHRNWTRNVLVGSGFGLRLRDELQKDIPPFRDSYQTATFLATQLAFAEPAPQMEARNERLARWLKPRIFEIGRTDAFDFSAGESKEESEEVDGAAIRTSIWRYPGIHPPPSDSFPYDLTKKQCLFLAASIALLLWFSSERLRRAVGGARRWVWNFPWVPGLTAVVLALIGMLIWSKWDGREGVPFRLLEGISLWPTEILRAGVVILTFSFMWMARCAVRKTRMELTERFFPRLASPSEPGWRERWKDGLAWARQAEWPEIWRTCEGWVRLVWRTRVEPADPEAVWEECLRRSRLRGLRVGVSTVVFLFLFLLVFTWLGIPRVPVRGHLIGVVDRVVLFLCVLLQTYLLFFVVDTTGLCATYATKLMKSEPTRWPESTRLDFRSSLQVRGTSTDSHTLVGTWINVHLIAEWTAAIGHLIYYPFIIMALMLAARSRLFADHDFPPALAIVFGCLLLYALVSANMLRNAAERGRRRALEILRLLGITLAADEAQKPEREKLSLMVKEIEELREGAFGLIYQQQYVRALLVLLTSMGGISAIEYLISGYVW